MIVDYIACGRAVLGAMPTLDTLVLERFFDDTGGMQLVHPLAARRSHQPGVRARAAQEVLPHLRLRAAGRGERRRDRAVARPAPQLPARRGRALRHQPHGRGDLAAGGPRRADVHLAVAVEPQPLAAGAALPRRPPQPAADPAHGSRRPDGGHVPAGRGLPGQPGRAGRDPRPRHRAPDDRRHAARRRSTSTGCASLLERIESGAVRVHTVDTTEPSVLAHEILTARPYAFLDDEEAPEPPHERGAHPPRARRSTWRRSAASTPTRSPRCTRRSRRNPRRATTSTISCARSC